MYLFKTQTVLYTFSPSIVLLYTHRVNAVVIILSDLLLPGSRNSKSGFKKSGSDVVKVCDMVIELAEDATIKLKAYNSTYPLLSDRQAYTYHLC